MIKEKTKTWYGILGAKHTLDNIATHLENVAMNIRRSSLKKINDGGTFEMGQTSVLYALRELGGQLSSEHHQLKECIDVLESYYTDYNSIVTSEKHSSQR